MLFGVIPLLILLFLTSRRTQILAEEKYGILTATDLTGIRGKLIGRMAWRIPLFLILCPVLIVVLLVLQGNFTPDEKVQVILMTLLVALAFAYPLLLARAALAAFSVVRKRRKEIEKQRQDSPMFFSLGCWWGSLSQSLPLQRFKPTSC